MGMWQRIKRVFRTLAGSSISALEDPEKILEQNIRELNEQVPKMNQSIAMVRANVTLLEKEMEKYRREISDLSGKIKVAIEAENDEAAAHYAVRFQQLQGHLADTEGQIDAARHAYDRSLEVKKLFLREKNSKIRQAQQALQEHRRAQWQARVADVLEGFDVEGLDATHDDMIRRIQEKTALSQARLEVALDSVDHKSSRIEEDAERLRAKELVERIKLQLGEEKSRPLEDGEPAGRLGEGATSKTGDEREKED